MMSPNTFGGTTLVHVPGVAVGGDAVAGLGDQPGERTQQHTTGRTGHGAVRIGDRHRAVRTRHVHRETSPLNRLNTRAVTQVSRDRHPGNRFGVMTEPSGLKPAVIGLMLVSSSRMFGVV